MTYPRQETVLERLEKETFRALREIEDGGASYLRKLWDDAKLDLRVDVMQQYLKDFPAGTWTFTLAKRRGTFERLRAVVAGRLENFKMRSVPFAGEIYMELRKEAANRHGWMLDSVTPPGVTPVVRGRKVREAGIRILTGEAGRDAYLARWGAWIDAYGTALIQNIGLGALNETTAQDAAGEVDETKVGSPKFDLGDALERIFRTQALNEMADELDDFFDENREIAQERVWQTRGDGRVCPICDDNDEKTEEDASDEIPAHPMCRCYYRVVPKAWMDLLGEQGETLRSRGFAPTTMAIADDEGNVRAHAWVEYHEWQPTERAGVIGR